MNDYDVPAWQILVQTDFLEFPRQGRSTDNKGSVVSFIRIIFRSKIFRSVNRRHMLEEDRKIGDRKIGDRKMFQWKAYYHNELFARLRRDGSAPPHFGIRPGADGYGCPSFLAPGTRPNPRPLDSVERMILHHSRDSMSKRNMVSWRVSG